MQNICTLDWDEEENVREQNWIWTNFGCYRTMDDNNNKKKIRILRKIK